MENRRKEDRIAVPLEIVVFDNDLQKPIGKLVDISPGGLCIRGTEPIEMYEQLEILLKLPKKILGRSEIVVYVNCMWTQPDADNCHWSSGFEFYDVSQKDGSTILGLVVELSTEH